MRAFSSLRSLALVALLGGLAAPAFAEPVTSEATPATIAANRAFAEGLPWADRDEEALARRGFVATRTDPLIRDSNGQVVWNLSAFDFATGPAPPTVNPSLWRHAGLLRLHGLFKVADRIWQVRGFDISNMTVIEGETGLILIDPLTTVEVARAALALAREHVGDKPVKAVIYTHSHADHFGGVRGVVDEADVRAGRVQIIAPEGFMEHAISENLIAGPAMNRRATYQFGTPLEVGPRGQMGAGIGLGIAGGTISLIAPSRLIKTTGETVRIDGVDIEFQMTPGTEAPAEMNLWLPQMNALGLAENANVTMHNILPPRGALVRDSRAWAAYLGEALERYGARSEVMFIQHGWPRWGREAIASYVALHRDAYKYLHDQSVRLMNQGLTGPEIAERIALPPELAGLWFNRGYYGTMRHNSRAVYQRYLGWYDANPVNLNPWPPEEAGKRYVSAMGGPQAALGVAQTAFDAGDYRWSAQVASHLVFADRANTAARELLAKSFEQMGYQAESALWRNAYLQGAREARQTPTRTGGAPRSSDLVAALPTTELFDLLAIRVDPDKAAGKDLRVAFVFPDRNERVLVSLRNRVLVHQLGGEGPVAATVTMPRPAFMGMLFNAIPPAQLVVSGTMRINGDMGALRGLMGSLDGAEPSVPFPIVTP